MADKEPKRGTPAFVTALIIATVMFVKYFLNRIFITLTGVVIKGDSDLELVLKQILASFIASIVCGFILAIALFKGVQNDSEERRLVMEYFRETPCDKQHIKEYMKNDKVRKKEFTRIAVMLFIFSAVLDFYNGMLFVIYPFVIEYFVMFGICRIFLYNGRYRLYTQWDSERLYR